MTPSLTQQLTIAPIEQVPHWDQFVAAHSGGTVFHTRAMVAACSKTLRYKPLALAAVAPDGTIAGILVAVTIKLSNIWPANFSARSVFFAEPIFTDDPSGADAIAMLLAEHDRQMQDQVVFAEIRPMMLCESSRQHFAKAGYECLEYNNYEIDLQLSADEIFRNMNRQRRTNIRSNERLELTVREADPIRELPVFYRHLTSSFNRSRVPLVDASHFREVFANLPSTQYRLTVAELNGRPIASACHLIFGERVYWWQAGTERVEGITAQASLVWETIQWAKERGEKVYDFAGAGWKNETYGPGTFKSRFGGQHVKVGRYRKVYSKLRMKIAETGYQLARPLIPNQSIQK